MSRLYYFTDSYPFSVDYTWKSAEIAEAAKEFDEVVIVPFTYRTENTFDFPNNVRVEQATIGNTLFAKAKYLKHLFSTTQPQKWTAELWKAIKKGKKGIVKWYLATVYSDLIYRSKSFQELKNLPDKENTVLFFQWTMNNALMIPKLKEWGYGNIICRMHGFDLYEYRHDHYLPYKSEILRAASLCTFISNNGKEYAEGLYPFISSKSQVHYLGADAMDTNHLKKGECFQLLSIARAVPLKRLHLISEALKEIKIPIKWTHIGDGMLLQELIEKAETAKQLNPNADFEFKGWLSPNEIKDFFSNNGINALVLLSETEGLPVVIMEAFSASIPVIATDVGGVKELVNSENGVLLRSNPELKEIIEAIEFLAKESEEGRDQRRTNARNSYEGSFDLKVNSKEFIRFLRSLLSNN